ncbi:MAG: terpene cyclase/mutase family protein [Planctomycetales bacterium]|nr:terpene cyclase/mutase family protein [Planctomycetales bacterium]
MIAGNGSIAMLGVALLVGQGGGDRLDSTRTLTIVLWCGLALLTVTLFILMRTRWGQAKPLSKCVALSILAHVLFGAYAYGTRLFWDMPAGPRQEVVHLTVLDTAIRPPDAASEAEADVAPWDVLDESPVTTGVELPMAQRQMTSAGALPDAPNADLPAAPQFAISADTGLERQLPVDHVAPEPGDLPQPPEALVQESGIGAATIETPAEPAPAAADSAEAEAPQLADGGATQGDDSINEGPERAVTDPPVAEVEMAPEVRPEEVAPPDFEPSVEELAQAALQARRPDALADNLNRLSQMSPLLDSPESTRASAADLPGAQVARRSTNWTPVGAGGGEGHPVPRRLGDGQPLPPLYRARVSDLRLTLAKQRGGDERTEAAVDSGLAWLVANQQPDGRWSAERHGAGKELQVLGHNRGGAGSKADTAVTGLAVLSLLAAGNTHYEGPYRESVQRGLEYLLGAQRADGCVAGDAQFFAQMYCHGMASLAVSEAYAMTGDQRLQRFVERAASYSATAQDSYSGGWRYRVGDRIGDMSQFGWQVMALKSAELAGVTLAPRTKQGMEQFLHASAAGAQGGLASYRPREKASPTMTAEALSCRYFLGHLPLAAQQQEAQAYLLQNLPSANERANYYYWYYGTLALYQTQGPTWDRWNRALVAELLRRQAPAAGDADDGSWSPDSSIWGGYGGRVYTTAMATLCLEVYYRYLPLYEQSQIAQQPRGLIR